MVRAHSTTRSAWKLLRTSPRGAAWNMACDHALADAVGGGVWPPVLRFYGWSPPAVSIGYNQPVRALRERLEALRARGFGVVRRPTGGRAVLHDQEVTYSAVIPADLPAPAGGVRSVCARIHTAILCGLTALGIADLSLHGFAGGPAQLAAAAHSKAGGGRRERLASPAAGALSARSVAAGVGVEAAGAAAPRMAPGCFATRSRSEIGWRGRKLVGSAQRRLQGAILQHGSILLAGDQAPLEQLWPGGSGAGRSTCLAEAGGRNFDFDEVVEAVRKGFEQELSVTFETAAVDPTLDDRVANLMDDRYGRDEFLYRI